MRLKPTLSRELRNAIKLSPFRRYALANKVGVHPTSLSSWLSGALAPPANDPRVYALGRLVGVPADRCFATASEQEEAGAW